MTFWSDVRRLLVGGLLLDDDVFVEMRDDPDGLARGLRFLVTLGLVVGLVGAAATFASRYGKSPADEMASVEAQLREGFERAQSFTIQDPDAQEAFDQVLQSISAGFDMAEGIADTVVETTPAPTALVQLLESLGDGLSRPFSWIASWLLWGVIVLLFARMLGGTATIQQMLATTSLVAAPHLLDALGFVPIGGGMLELLALLWGLAVFIKGTAVANRISGGTAIVAFLAPIVIVALTVMMAVLAVVFFAVAVA